jgi:hypothetical protein
MKSNGKALFRYVDRAHPTLNANLVRGFEGQSGVQGDSVTQIYVFLNILFGPEVFCFRKVERELVHRECHIPFDPITINSNMFERDVRSHLFCPPNKFFSRMDIMLILGCKGLEALHSGPAAGKTTDPLKAPNSAPSSPGYSQQQVKC